MATTKPATKAKPAAKPAEPAKKPAAKKPAANTGVGIKELAADLNRDPRSVRASIRRALGGAQVGQGGRYHWASKKDKQYQELVTLLTKSDKDEETDEDDE